MAKGGKRVGAGRKKGTANKFNAELKDMIRAALDQAGGQEYLAQQAVLNPGPFMALLGKILPKDMNVNATGDLNIHWPIPRTKLDE